MQIGTDGTCDAIPRRVPVSEGYGELKGPVVFAGLALSVLAAGCDPPQPATPRAGSPAANDPPQGALPAPPTPQSPAGAATAPGAGWNSAQIAWVSYADGLARARAEHKPVCLVFHADWCPHCRSYARVFEDPRVVARARDLVMVRVNVDQAPDVAGRYQLDGPYVPRTYFLSPDGTTLANIDAHRPQFRYFFDEHDPNSVLAGMDAALRAR